MKAIQYLFLALIMGCVDPMPVRAEYTPDSHREPCVTKKTPKPLEKPVAKNTTTPVKSAKVDINQASATELATLPGIGPALAKRIIAYRTKRPFRRTSHIKRVRGIGAATYSRIKDRIEVRAKPPQNRAKPTSRA